MPEEALNSKGHFYRSGRHRSDDDTSCIPIAETRMPTICNNNTNDILLLSVLTYQPCLCSLFLIPCFHERKIPSNTIVRLGYRRSRALYQYPAPGACSTVGAACLSIYGSRTYRQNVAGPTFCADFAMHRWARSARCPAKSL